MKRRAAAKEITAKEFDARCDAGEDISPWLDLDSAIVCKPGKPPVWGKNGENLAASPNTTPKKPEGKGTADLFHAAHLHRQSALIFANLAQGCLWKISGDERCFLRP